MKEYELWLILMDISNYEKVKLIEKYNNEEWQGLVQLLFQEG